MTTKPRDVQRLCYSVPEAAEALGIGETLFREQVLPQIPQLVVGPVTLVKSDDVHLAWRGRAPRTDRQLARVADLMLRRRAGYRVGRYPKDTRGDVYFLQCSGIDGPIKIGMTRNLPKRMRGLADTIPMPLVLLATAPGGRELEAHLHELFSATRLRGEWFSPSTDLLGLIRALQGQTQ